MGRLSVVLSHAATAYTQHGTVFWVLSVMALTAGNSCTATGVEQGTEHARGVSLTARGRGREPGPLSVPSLPNRALNAAAAAASSCSYTCGCHGNVGIVLRASVTAVSICIMLGQDDVEEDDEDDGKDRGGEGRGEDGGREWRRKRRKKMKSQKMEEEVEMKEEV